MEKKQKKQSEHGLFGLDFPPTMYQRIGKEERRERRECDPYGSRTPVRDLFDDPDDFDTEIFI